MIHIFVALCMCTCGFALFSTGILFNQSTPESWHIYGQGALNTMYVPDNFVWQETGLAKYSEKKFVASTNISDLMKQCVLSPFCVATAEHWLYYIYPGDEPQNRIVTGPMIYSRGGSAAVASFDMQPQALFQLSQKQQVSIRYAGVLNSIVVGDTQLTPSSSRPGEVTLYYASTLGSTISVELSGQLKLIYLPQISFFSSASHIRERPLVILHWTSVGVLIVLCIALYFLVCYGRRRPKKGSSGAQTVGSRITGQKQQGQKEEGTASRGRVIQRAAQTLYRNPRAANPN